MSSFKSSENIQKKEGGPDRSASDNQSSSVTLNVTLKKIRSSYHVNTENPNASLTHLAPFK